MLTLTYVDAGFTDAPPIFAWRRTLSGAAAAMGRSGATICPSR